MLQYVCEGGWTLVVVSFCHHHWSEFFSPRLLLLVFMQCAWWISRVDLCQLCYCSHHWSEFFAYFTISIFILAAAIHTLRRFCWRHSCTRQVVLTLLLTSSLVRVLLCWKRKYWLRSIELPTTCWKGTISVLLTEFYQDEKSIKESCKILRHFEDLS